MPLPLPDLDQRTYDSLIAESRDLLPVFAPEWTDFNASDPGVTLVELLAYLTDLNSYRLNRVTPEQRRAWLHLMGYRVAPSTPARTPLVFSGVAAGTPLPLPRGVRVSDAGGRIVFQTTACLDVHPASLVAALTWHDGTWTDHGSSVGRLSESFAALGDNPQPDDAFYLGFDRPLEGATNRLRLFVFGEDEACDRLTWQALIAEARSALHQQLGIRPPDCGSAREFWLHYGARVVWEYFDTDGHWRALPALRDRSCSLSLSGPVSFQGLATGRHAPSNVADCIGRYFIRCRLRKGAYDLAPRLRGARLNVVQAEHAGEAPPAHYGPAKGWAGESFALPGSPLLPRRTRLSVTAPDGEKSVWFEVPDLDQSGPFDAHFVVQPENAVVSFGDGRRGRVPPAGADIEAHYAIGGGEQGNVPAGTLTVVGPPESGQAWPITLAVEQALAASGGKPAETLEQAEVRAARELPAARCAVTLDDYARQARQVPGIPVARSWAVAEFHPRHPGLPAAGCITIIVVPTGKVPAMPTPAMLRGIGAYLDRRRPIATELHVIGPRYTRVTVEASLVLSNGENVQSVALAARAALDCYFDPIHGGPEGDGWPAGRDVHRSEVMAVLMAVPGVQRLGQLSLQRDDDVALLCGNLPLCPDALVVSGTHRLTTG